ncbi:MAG TPA: hypothetical protein VLE27_02100 [Thermoanaerobaculia bacterium]|nr:hypothetical protein [Thermoanaerobaculia bacterium]
MKNVVRILSLTAALAFAAMPPATSETLGPCRYSCCSTNPFQCTSYTTYTTASQCCSGDLTCPAGTTVRVIGWGNPIKRCAV